MKPVSSAAERYFAKKNVEPERQQPSDFISPPILHRNPLAPVTNTSWLDSIKNQHQFHAPRPISNQHQFVAPRPVQPVNQEDLRSKAQSLFAIPKRFPSCTTFNQLPAKQITNELPQAFVKNNHFEGQTSNLYSSAFNSRPQHRFQSLFSVPDFCSSVANQTYVVDKDMSKFSSFNVDDNDDEELFGAKENDNMPEFTSDYFSSKSKDKDSVFNFEFTPPEKRLKLSDIMDTGLTDVFPDYPSLCLDNEMTSKSDSDSGTKITTESLFADNYSVNLDQLFNQSEAQDISEPSICPIEISTSSVSSSSPANDEIIDATKKKTVEKTVDSDLSSSSNPTNGDLTNFFDQLFDKKEKSVAKIVTENLSASENVETPVESAPVPTNKQVTKTKKIPSNFRPVTSSASMLTISTAASKRIVLSSISHQNIIESKRVAKGNLPAPSVPVRLTRKSNTNSQPVISTTSKQSHSPVSSSEPLLSTSSKDLEMFNDALEKIDFSKIDYDKVNTFYSTKERKCLFEDVKKKKRLEEEPPNLEGEDPKFEEVKKVKFNQTT